MIYPSMTKEKTTTTLNDGLSNYTVLYLGVLLKPCTGDILKKMSTKLIIQFIFVIILNQDRDYKQQQTLQS